MTHLQQYFLRFIDLYGRIIATPKMREEIEQADEQHPAYSLVEKIVEVMQSGPYNNAHKVIAEALLAKILSEDFKQYAELARRPVQ